MVVRKRLDITGPTLVFITTTVFDWQPVLTQRTVADIIIEELRKTQCLFEMSIVSYVVMPSHLYLLLGFQEVGCLSQCIQSFKSITSRRIKDSTLQKLASNGYRLWKPRFDDLVVHSERQLKIKMEYIHNNPVRAGLVERAEDWLYSSAIDWLSSKHGMLEIDKEFGWLAKR